MRNAIREFIELHLMLERMMGRGEFKLSEFKKLDEPFKMIAYVHDVLKQLGEGTSRVTYLLSSSKVLKIARPNEEEKGRAQNQTELDVFTSPRTKPIVARIFDYDPGFSWLISELVRPIDENEFKQRFGLKIETVFEFVYEIHDSKTTADEYLKSKPRIAKLFTTQARSFIDNCVSLMRENGLSVGDLNIADHWGKTAANRIVLLDYGLTHDVYRTHYDDDSISQTAKTVS